MGDAPKTVPVRSGDAELSPVSDSLEATICLSCGTLVTRHFCSECGQPLIDPNPTLRELLHELAEGFLNWDGKLLGTLRLLVTSPGTLTQEYLAGRRVRFISPLRLYLTCSFLFFFVKAVLPDAPIQIQTTTTHSGQAASAKSSSMQIGVVTVQQSDDAESQKQLDALAKSGSGIMRVWWSHFASALRNRGALSAAVAANVPRMMFVLVPMFAALVALVFRRRRMRYPQHLAFALHVHAFLFLALILALAPRIIKTATVNAVLVSIGFAAIAVHFVMATRRVYEVSVGGAIARSALIAATYFVLYAFAFAALFVGAVMLI